MHKIKSFIKTYSNAIKDKNAAIFAGAGLSRPAGIVDWKGLLKSITEDLNLDIDKENDIVAITQYHINERAGVRSTVNRLLIEHFTKDVEITENHRILAKLPINTYWTTNYDKLLEKALEDAG
jgi:NAD-dependent SIR2 family protein deacetylase